MDTLPDTTLVTPGSRPAVLTGANGAGRAAGDSERMAFLLDVSARLAGPLTVSRTALRLLRLATPYLGLWAMVALFHGGTTTLYARPAGGRATGPVTVTAPTDRLAGLDRIRRGGRTERLRVAPDAAGLAALIPDGGLLWQAAALCPADVLGVGLTTGGSTLGALVVVRGGRRGYDAADVDLTEEVAGRAAAALDSARLHEERDQVASALRAELRPPELPAVDGVRLAAGYRAANGHLDIGGDFYDVYGRDGDWSVVIGDVCGKGVRPAVLTGRTRQTVRTAAHFDRSPAAVLTALNDVLYEAGSDRFVTVAYARVRPDAASGTVRVTLAVAGHPPPMVVRADRRVETPRVRGTVSGVLADLSYDEVELVLEPGDLTLFYTDGIYEARGPDGFYGAERLRALLSEHAGAEPTTVCEAIERSVAEHLDGGPHDDMALLAMLVPRQGEA